jgi:Ser/Thr protein kinase RdoA (MazF antagonist)
VAGLSPDEAAAREAALAFLPGGRCRRLARSGSGHIHDTWLAELEGAAGTHRAVLQRLNGRVFPDLGAVMSNVLRVTEHLRRRLAAEGVPDAARRCLELLPARGGGFVHVDAAGHWWRGFRYVEGTRSFDRVPGPDAAREAGRAFGRFAVRIADLEGPPLAIPIEGFHCLPRRVGALEAARAADACGRAAAVARDLDGALALNERLSRVFAAEGGDELPRRIAHNDCKLNNVLLDERSGEALCVIDLDTVMPDTLLSDFGELVRSSVCDAPEDEPDPSRIGVDLALFRAVAEGWAGSAAPLLGEAERALLPLAGARLALENAVRFLADHLGGDVYFRIQRVGHNLDRARAQLRLAECLWEARERLRGLVAEALSGRFEPL